MKLNCKPGDLAVYVRSSADNVGKIVRCVRFVGRVPGWRGDDRWETESIQRGTLGCRTNTACDSKLKPLRDPGDDAVDETLSWSTPGQRSQRDADRCKRLVDEVCGVSK